MTLEASHAQPARTWTCSHGEDQTGGKRCVRCCVDKGLNYVLRRAAGGSPAAWRFRCSPCLSVYRELQLIDEVGTAYGGSHVRANLSRMESA